MRIGDAAAAAGTTPRALRFYEQRGLLSAPPRTATGQRRYGPREVTRVRLIRELLALGLTIEDVAVIAEDDPRVLDGESLPPCTAPECAGTRTARVVGRRLGVLDGEIERLSRLRDALASRVPARPGADAPSSPADGAAPPGGTFGEV